VTDLDPEVTPAVIADSLRRLSADPAVNGIILQTPLPRGARLAELADAIDPAKDVDGANPLSLGRLAAGLPAFAPATAQAVMAILDHYQIEPAGAHTVVVGRSLVVGKPLAHLLLNRDATVTVCHSRTRDLPQITRTADILIVAVGRPGLITGEHVRPGTTVIDVGTNPTPDGSGITGDVDALSVAEKADALTPVPGGVGPVTTALLLRQTLTAATLHR
jgi:methylenetetrahydrofolate dehydrogenase (NADP+)/methenyltetrahydrofolate cyclohydrolase